MRFLVLADSNNLYTTLAELTWCVVNPSNWFVVNVIDVL